jgi:aminopeptidase N
MIWGEVAITFKAGERLRQVTLDLSSALAVDSAWTQAGTAVMTRLNEHQIAISLAETLAVDQVGTLHLRYEGEPVDAAGNSLFRGTGGGLRSARTADNAGVYGEDSADVFSSPFGTGAAHFWWPCKDTATDKATMTISVTAPGGIHVAASGRLTALSPGDSGLSESLFTSPFPVAPDWFALSAGPGVISSATYNSASGGQELPLEFHAFAADTAAAFQFWGAMSDRPGGALAVLEGLFGPYPFLDADLGADPLFMVEIPGAGVRPGQGLGRQGQLDLTGDDRDLRHAEIARLLSRQWFGASVTPKGPVDLWMTDGFTSYAAALTAEATGGPEAYRAALGRMSRPSFAAPVAYLPVREDSLFLAAWPDSFFLEAASNKGAWVLHTLRWILSNLRSPGAASQTDGRADPAASASADSLFFRVLRDFPNVSPFHFGNASSADFVRYCEEKVGADLHWYFGPWLFGLGLPRLAFDWSAPAADTGGPVHLHLEQLQQDPIYPDGDPYPGSPHFFPMYWEVLLQGPAGERTSLVVRQTSRMQDFSLPASHPVTSVILDPDHWVLCSIEALPHLNGPEVVRIQPNPVHGSAQIVYRVGSAAPADPGTDGGFQLALFDVAGRRLRSLVMGNPGAGLHVLTWDGRDDRGSSVAQGAYFVQARQGDRTASGKLLVIGR